MKKQLLYFALLLFSGLPVTAQLSQARRWLGDKQEIVFDTSGRMIGFPRVYATEQTRLAFKITVPAGLLTEEFATFAKKLQETKKFIDTHSGTVNPGYSCLFGAAFTAFTEGLDKALHYLDQGIPCDRGALQRMIDTFSLIRSPAPAKPGTTAPDPSQKQDTFAATAVLPFQLMLQNILDRQYAVVLNNGNICTDTIFLKAQLTGCRPGCIDFIAEPTAIQDALCKACGVKNLSQVNFKLLHLDPLRQTIIDWNKIQLSDPEFVVDEQFDNLVAAICDASKATGNIPKKTSLYTKWLLGWLWYTKGELVWNPFPSITKTTKDSITAAIKVQDKLLDSAKAMGVFLDSAKANEVKTFAHEYAFTGISNRIKSNNDFIDSVSKKKDTLQQQLKTDVVDAIKKVNFLYAGVLKLSRYGGLDHSASVNPQKQFDAAMNFQSIPLSNRHQAQVTEVPENEKLYFLVHNIANGTRARIFDSPLPFNDLEEFTKLVNDQLSLINFSDVTNAMLQKLQSFTASLTPYNKQNDLAHDFAGADTSKPDCHVACIFLQQLKRERDAKGNGFLPKTDLFNQRTLSDPFYSTYMQAANIDEAPYKDTFTIKQYINKDSAVVMKSSIRIGKLRFVEIAAGIAITRNPVYTTSIDTASGGFRVSSLDNQARAIVGFKFYPWRNFRRDNSLIPRYLFRRLSVFGGFELLDPLKNFYVGGAYDVVPGLAFSMGANYYLQTNYRIQNNAVTDTYRTYKKSSPYYAVMVNPVLFVQFVKLFFK